MNDSWKNVRLGDVCRLINGRAYKKPELLENGKYPVLRVGNFFTNRSWYYSDLELDADKYCDDGDLLYAWSASFGPRIWQGGKVIYHYHIWKTEIDCSRLEKEFLFYWFEWDKERIKAEQGAGTTMIHVTKGSMENRNLLLPSLPEQKRIVAILDEAFAGIAAAVANTEKNLANARELFDNYLDAVFTQKGDGWVEKTLKDLGKAQTGSTPKTSNRENYGNFIPFIKPADFKRDGSLNYENEGLSEQGLASARKVDEDSVLMVCIGATIGKCGWCDQDITTNQQINTLTPVANVSHKFVYYQMLTEGFQRCVLSDAGQATLPIINKSKWSALSIWLPATLSDQNSIVEQLDSLQAQTHQLEAIYQKKLKALAQLKQSILQKAFSCELSANPEKTLSEVI